MGAAGSKWTENRSRLVTIDAQRIKDSGKNQTRDERGSMDGLKSQKSPKMKRYPIKY